MKLADLYVQYFPLSRHVEIWPKILLILYPSLWNSTTHITIIKIKGCAKSDRAKLIQSSFPSLSLMLKAKCARAKICKGDKTSEVNYLFVLSLKNWNFLKTWFSSFKISLSSLFVKCLKKCKKNFIQEFLRNSPYNISYIQFVELRRN